MGSFFDSPVGLAVKCGGFSGKKWGFSLCVPLSAPTFQAQCAAYWALGDVSEGPVRRVLLPLTWNQECNRGCGTAAGDPVAYHAVFRV